MTQDIKNTLECNTGCNKLGDEPITKATMSTPTPSGTPSGSEKKEPKQPECKKCTVTIPCHWIYIGLGIAIIGLLIGNDKKSKKSKP